MKGRSVRIWLFHMAVSLGCLQQGSKPIPGSKLSQASGTELANSEAAKGAADRFDCGSHKFGLAIFPLEAGVLDPVSDSARMS